MPSFITTLIYNTPISDVLEIGDILRNAISEYGEQRILSDIVQGESAEVIKHIFEQCMSNIEKTDGIKPDTRVTVSEGLMHYLLTITMIPSKRKTTFQSVDIDIAVPDTITLGTSPQDVIMISFPKTSDVNAIKSQIENMKKIQPNTSNIWMILEKDMQYGVKTYTLQDTMTFTNIINDLIGFTSNKKQSKLKIFKI
ncbi:MAG: hypothetical protein KGI19_08070 [Thaumarchaeota archaeon]|nr:hypothetical protein [Nitrososphaerota archaeon]MDE1818542.1 hypothetical protein [Nitrososphaerota archaeon]